GGFVVWLLHTSRRGEDVGRPGAGRARRVCEQRGPGRAFASEDVRACGGVDEETCRCEQQSDARALHFESSFCFIRFIDHRTASRGAYSVYNEKRATVPCGCNQMKQELPAQQTETEAAKMTAFDRQLQPSI